MLYLAGWTAVTWTAAAFGSYGWAVACAFGALIHGTAIAMRSLNRERLCHVCGNPFITGRLGMCGTCAHELRPTR